RLYVFDVEWDDPPNAKVGGVLRNEVKTFICPSAPVGGRHANRGCLDYAATTERNWPNPFVSAAMTPFLSAGDPYYIGVLGNDKVTNNALDPCKRRIVDILDGTTNTMLLAECAGRNRRFIMGKEDPSQTWTAGPWGNPNSRLQIGGFNPAIPTDP